MWLKHIESALERIITIGYDANETQKSATVECPISGKKLFLHNMCVA